MSRSRATTDCKYQDLHIEKSGHWNKRAINYCTTTGLGCIWKTSDRVARSWRQWIFRWNSDTLNDFLVDVKRSDINIIKENYHAHIKYFIYFLYMNFTFPLFYLVSMVHLCYLCDKYVVLYIYIVRFNIIQVKCQLYILYQEIALNLITRIFKIIFRDSIWGVSFVFLIFATDSRFSAKEILRNVRHVGRRVEIRSIRTRYCVSRLSPRGGYTRR